MDTTQFTTLVEAQAGDVYRLGAEVPPSAWDDRDPSDVWDCSELVQVAYGAAGVKISDGAWLQYDATSAITGDPRIGDLVFLRNNPARPNGIGHVGIITRLYSNANGVYDARITEAKGKDYGVVFSTLSAWRKRASFAGVRRLAAFTAAVKPPAIVYSWVLVHAGYPEARAHLALAERDGDAGASRRSQKGAHTHIKSAIEVVQAMDDPAKRAAVLKAAGLS